MKCASGNWNNLLMYQMSLIESISTSHSLEKLSFGFFKGELLGGKKVRGGLFN